MVGGPLVGDHPLPVQQVDLDRGQVQRQLRGVPPVAADVAPFARPEDPVVAVGDGLPSDLQPEGGAQDVLPFEIGLLEVQLVVVRAANGPVVLFQLAQCEAGILQLGEDMGVLRKPIVAERPVSPDTLNDTNAATYLQG